MTLVGSFKAYTILNASKLASKCAKTCAARLAQRATHIRNSGVPICRQCEFIRLYCTYEWYGRPVGIYSVEYRGSSRIIVMQSRPKLNIFHEYKSSTSPEMDGPLTPIS